MMHLLISRYTPRRLLRQAIVFLFCALLSAPGLAQVGLSDPLAQDLKKQGDAAMTAGDYEAALDAYTRATSIENSPLLLYNRGRALQALERFPEALAHLEAFQVEAPEELKSRVPGLDGLLEGIRNQVSEISIELGVRDATVTLDGNEIEVGPESSPTRVNSGSGTLEVTAKGYEPYKKRVKLPGGESVKLSVKLIPLDRTGLLRVTSSTPGAELSVDGTRAGMTPTELALPAGEHTVKVTHARHVPFSTQVIIQPKGTKSLQVDLEKRPGLVKKWWFWTGVGAALIGATAIVIVATTERAPDEGDIPPGQVSAPAALQMSF